MNYFLKDVEENFVLAVVVRPRKREVGVVTLTKVTDVAKELMVAIVLSKILTVHSKTFRFYARLE